MIFLSRLKLSGIILCCFISALSAQAQKKYPALLWEITGNGLSKPSYLYGTMHVSSKLAWHLSDSFFVALNAVNTVGLESNPDEWLKNMKEMGLLEQLNNPNTYYNTDFYKEAFKPSLPENKQYAEILANDPDLINNLLYRNSVTRDEHEEATYVDLFIYKTGAKLGKKIISLENFKTSLIMATKASTPDANDVYDAARSKIDYYKVQTEIKDAYRNGDLDALDSLSRLTYTYKNTQKYLIDDRNVILAKSIDSVNKTGNTIFAGIGAAHLPGKDGVIELLRKMGYKLRPVSGIYTKKSIKEKENIESIIKKLPYSIQYAKDSAFTFELFDAPVNLANLQGFSFSLATDMANGSYYMISRQTTFASLYNGSIESIRAKIDSMLYENIPGKIISRKEISSNTGIKGIDIINKTKKGDFQRYQIFFPENEMILFKMSGKGEYVKGAEATRFFNSIKFKPLKENSDYTFSPPTQGFSVTSFPVNKYIYNKRHGLQGLAETFFTQDNSKHITAGVMHYYYHDFDYLEEDTFELNLLCSSTLKNFNYTANNTRTLTTEQNLPCVTFSGDNTSLNRTFYGKIFIKGIHYYLVYAITNIGSAIPKDYFSSFKIKDFKHTNEIKSVTDHDFAFTVMDEIVPDDKNQLQEALAGFYEEQQKEKDKKNHSTAFDYQSKSKTYYSPSSGEHINIQYEKYNDYDCRDQKKFWKDVKELSKKSSFIISKDVYRNENGVETYDVFLKDTACSSIIQRKYLLKEGLLFCLSAVYDSVSGPIGWTDSFLKSFKHKDTNFTKPIFVNKTAALLRDLSSADSSIKYAAITSLQNNAFSKEGAADFIKYIQTPEFLKLSEDSRAIILTNGGTLEDEKIIPHYKKLYNYYADSSYMQVCIIKGLAFLRTQNSYNTIYDLLKNNTPLTGDQSVITDIVNPMYDSLELCSGFFPGLFSLSTFEEYKTPMFKLFADLVIRDVIPASKYATQLPVILVDANNELKRYNTSSSKAKTSNYDEAAAMAAAEELAAMFAQKLEEEVNPSPKKVYPKYFEMIENYAVVLAPYYATNNGAKQYFDKLWKIKHEKTLLNITLIAAKNKIAVNDTLWKFFSNNAKTKLKLFKELGNLKMLEKFDQSKLSQEDFCKTGIEEEITMYDYSYDDDNSSLKEKVKPDSIVFIRKEPVKNKKEEGNLYFFERTDNKNKTKSLAYAFVKKGDKVTANFEVLDTKHVIEIGKTQEETIKTICSDFYYKGRQRYIGLKNNNYSYYDGMYEE